nr:MAG TPA: hypothetical protein [Caudoviricetes sp.]
MPTCECAAESKRCQFYTRAYRPKSWRTGSCACRCQFYTRARIDPFFRRLEELESYIYPLIPLSI